MLKLSARAVPDPHAADEIAVWRDDAEVGAIDDPAESRSRLYDWEAGRAVIARLEVTAEIYDGERLVPYEGFSVGGVWFSATDPEANNRHSEEMIREHAEEIVTELRRRGALGDAETDPAPAVEVVISRELQAALGR